MESKYSPNIITRIGFASGAVLLGMGGVACSGDGGNGDPSYVPREPGVTAESSTTSSAPESATTTTNPEFEKSDHDLILERLEAAGYSPELAEEILAMGETPINNPEECIAFVADAKGGESKAVSDGWLKRVNGELIVNTSMFTTAGEGIIENDGPNMFTDSVGQDYMEGDQSNPQEVAYYFGDPNKVQERTREAVAELFARLCGDPYELSSALTSAANIKLGGTDVRLGEIFKGSLGDYLIDGDVTPEALTDMAQKALSKFVIEYPEGVDTEAEREAYLADHPGEAAKRVDAYENQLVEASKIAAVLRNFMGYINTKDVHVDMSSQIFGTDEANYPDLIFSNAPIDATGQPHGLGGEYDAITGTLLQFFVKPKAGCVAFENGALVLNLLDGRSGFTHVLVSAPEGCVPMIVTTTSTPNSIPSKHDDGKLPGDGTGASQDPGTPDVPGTGPAGQQPGGGGYVPGETTPSTQAPNTSTSTTNPTTSAPVPASTSVSTTVPQGGTLPPPPGPERIVHSNRVTTSEVVLNPVSNRARLASSVIIRL